MCGVGSAAGSAVGRGVAGGFVGAGVGTGVGSGIGALLGLSDASSGEAAGEGAMFGVGAAMDGTTGAAVDAGLLGEPAPAAATSEPGVVSADRPRPARRTTTTPINATDRASDATP